MRLLDNAHIAYKVHESSDDGEHELVRGAAERTARLLQLDETRDTEVCFLHGYRFYRARLSFNCTRSDPLDDVLLERKIENDNRYRRNRERRTQRPILVYGQSFERLLC